MYIIDYGSDWSQWGSRTLTLGGSLSLFPVWTYCFKWPTFRSLSTRLWYAHFLLRSLIAGSDFIVSGHLNSGSLRIRESNFSYVMVRGVSGICGRCSPCSLLDAPHWLEGLSFLATSHLAAWPVTKICWVAAQTSYSSIEYLFACQNVSSMVVVGFLAKDSKNGVPGHMLCLKIWRTTSML